MDRLKSGKANSVILDKYSPAATRVIDKPSAGLCLVKAIELQSY
ncbi:MAG TPA: hypothetical protein VJ729_03005 [Nitrososphaeraceae archaeon]|nr:hypothetical protein [Nitrososphaeraceae archaeon]